MNEAIDMDDSSSKTNNHIDLLPYYVYELRDPRTNEVFYVGKGTHNRIDAHSAAEENAKARRIEAIEREGLAVWRIIIGRFRTEDEAFAVEAVCIKWVYGFDKLANQVHGHRHRFVRPHTEKDSAMYTRIPGIDKQRTVDTGRTGAYTEDIRTKISANQVLEKLESLRDALRLHADFRHMTVGEPDLSTPQDPCLIVTGFDPAAVRLQIKMQLTGATVVLNLVPSDASQKTQFRAALAHIDAPFEVQKGNGGFGGAYTQTHDFKSANGGYPRGIPQDDVDSIVRLSRQAIARLAAVKP